MVASLFESLVEQPVAAQHKKLMLEPLLKAAALLKEFHKKMPTVFNLEVSTFPTDLDKPPHEIDFIDHFEKVDKMSEALKQPKFADAVTVIGRFMATHV